MLSHGGGGCLASKGTEVIIAKPTPDDANACFKTAACMLSVSMRCSVDLGETVFPLRPCAMP